MTTQDPEPDVNPMSRISANPRPDGIEAAPVLRSEHRESLLTRMIEHQTAKVPSNVFLFAALSSMAASLILELNGRERAGRFIGRWVGPLLTMGLYNKMVKTFGAR